MQKIVQRTYPSQSFTKTWNTCGSIRSSCPVLFYREDARAARGMLFLPSPGRCRGKPLTAAFPGDTLCVWNLTTFFSFRNFGNIVQSSKVTIQITSPDDLQDVVVNASDLGSCLISCLMCQGFWVFRCRSSTQYLLVWNPSMKRWKRRQMTLEDTV